MGPFSLESPPPKYVHRLLPFRLCMTQFPLPEVKVVFPKINSEMYPQVTAVSQALSFFNASTCSSFVSHTHWPPWLDTLLQSLFSHHSHNWQVSICYGHFYSLLAVLWGVHQHSTQNCPQSQLHSLLLNPKDTQISPSVLLIAAVFFNSPSVPSAFLPCHQLTVS